MSDRSKEAIKCLNYFSYLATFFPLMVFTALGVSDSHQAEIILRNVQNVFEELKEDEIALGK